MKSLSRVAVVGGPAGVGLILVMLQRAGGPSASGQSLSGPPLTDPAGWVEWAAEREPFVAAFGLFRLVALAVAWYLLVTMVVGLLARASASTDLVRAADRFTVPALRRFMATVVTAGVTGAQVGILPTAATPVLTVAAVAAQAPETGAGEPEAGATPATVVMRRLTGQPETTPTPGAVPPAIRVDTPAPGAIPPAPPHVPSTWTVQPGQCFWSIAVEVLAGHWGRLPSDAEIVPYWLRLIEVNRPALADPGNADLVFPAQVFAIPPVA